MAGLKMEKFGEKGQAALTDSLFFLLIVSGLSTFLFFFVSSYGHSIDLQLLSEYRQDYAASALKTIMYSSIPRIEGQNIDETLEVDYLLAETKEDYADDETLNLSQEKLKTISTEILKPFNQNSDYIFYIYLPEKQAFQFFLLSLTETATEQVPTDKRRVNILSSEKNLYSCRPASLNDVMTKFLTKAGNLAQTNARSKFSKLDEKGDEKFYTIAQVSLVIWIPTKIDPAILGELNCCKWGTANCPPAS